MPPLTHRTLGGPGLLESITFEEALVWELGERGLEVERQKLMPITTKERTCRTAAAGCRRQS
ncbi:MAG: GxxExxY protein [Anaerolineae bacterium]